MSVRAEPAAPAAEVTVGPLRTADIDAVAPLTFPAYRPLLARCIAAEPEEGRAPIALVAHAGARPIGLALARVAAGTGQPAELLSISVTPALRCQGVGTVLLLALERMLAENSCPGIYASYTTRLSQWQAFEALLRACHWRPPQPELLMATGNRAQLDAPWLAGLGAFPPGFEPFVWSALTADERAQLEREVAAGEIPVQVSPLPEDEPIEPACSVGVRYRGEVVGWMIVTRSPLVPDALSYRAAYVRPQLRAARALGPLLLAEALRRHAGSPLAQQRPIGLFAIAYTGSAKMINFFRKRLAPHCLSVYETRTAARALPRISIDSIG